MIYYAFNDNKPLFFNNKNKPFIMIHYCAHCNSEIIGEWTMNEKGKIKVTQKQEVIRFSNLRECPVCGGELKENIHHHFANLDPSFALGYFRSKPCEDIKRDFHSLVEKFSVDYADLPNDAGHSLRAGQKVITADGPVVIMENRPEHSQIWVRCHDNTTESILSFLEYFRLQERDQAVEIKLNQLIDKNLSNSENTSIGDIESKSNFNLKKYLEQLLLIEKNIFSVSKRLRELYLLESGAEKDAIASEKIPLLDDKKIIERAFEDYKSLESKNVEDEIKKEDFRPLYPKVPKMPKKPKAPILATPGFFNRKRVLAENALLTEKYDEELETYNAAVEKFESDMENYKETIALLKKQCADEYNSAIEKAKETLEKEIIEAKSKYEDLLKKYEDAKLSAKDIPTPEKAKHMLLTEEIAMAEELLEKFYKAQNEMYSYGVIFEKYRNFVAVSSFFEYISSGRCETLEGADGAYNLYENEIRMNMVIGQLNQVIESLEEIKQNQYMIYSAIQETNSQLSKLNSSMGSVISALSSISADTSDMKSYMSKIVDNTEVIAYNTEKTAYYAKKNAELTNALGFMVALK